MSYQLYRRVDLLNDRSDAVLLGAYEEFAAALAARDEDTVALLAATDAGEVMVVRHDIVGPGAHGTSTTHPVTTALERQDSTDRDELTEVRDWLTRVHGLAG
jgi:hypothetical protein